MQCVQKYGKLHTKRAEKQMEHLLGRLADLILEEMEKKKCSATYFADFCGISRNELGKIVNRQKKDIRLSTVWSICENSEIRFSDIFDIECAEEFDLENYIITNGKEKYAIRKLGRGNKTSAF